MSGQPTITIGRDQAASHWHACFYDAEGTCVKCSDWWETPETALAVLMSKLRVMHRELGNRRVGDLDAREKDLYLWLCGLLG